MAWVQVRQEIDRRIQEKEEEFENTRWETPHWIGSLKGGRIPVFFFSNFFWANCNGCISQEEPRSSLGLNASLPRGRSSRQGGGSQDQKEARDGLLFFLALLCFYQNFRTSTSLKLLWTTQTRPMRRLTRRSNATKTSTGGVMANNLKAKLIISIFQITGRSRPLTSKRQDSARRWGTKYWNHLYDIGAKCMCLTKNDTLALFYFVLVVYLGKKKEEPWSE